MVNLVIPYHDNLMKFKFMYQFKKKLSNSEINGRKKMYGPI